MQTKEQPPVNTKNIETNLWLSFEKIKCPTLLYNSCHNKINENIVSTNFFTEQNTIKLENWV